MDGEQLYLMNMEAARKAATVLAAIRLESHCTTTGDNINWCPSEMLRHEIFETFCGQRYYDVAQFDIVQVDAQFFRKAGEAGLEWADVCPCACRAVIKTANYKADVIENTSIRYGFSRVPFLSCVSD